MVLAMKKWKCSVCGYIHKGDEPPETCPVCGADKSKFTLEEQESPNSIKDTNIDRDTQATDTLNEQVEEAEKSFKQISFFDKHPNFTRLLTNYHLHPITVHIPNGVLPLSVLFTILAIIFDNSSLAIASKVNMIFVLFSMPLVLFSGYIDWINRYQGKMTKAFKTKIWCGIIITILTFIIVIWRIIQPDILSHGFNHNKLFLLINFVVLILATIAGFYGGKLVFKK
jgi:rubredoxin/uncharacterized membrane protein